MLRLKTLLLVIAICVAEKPKIDETKNLREKSDKHSPGLQKSNFDKKKTFLSDLSILEQLAANSTEIPTTIRYDSNYTTIEEDFTNITTEYDNSTESMETTEISLFGKPNVEITTEAPIKKDVKISKQKYCDCDLTYEACDVNCCCDADCSEEDTKIFSHCLQSKQPYDDRYCYSHMFYYKNNSQAKINLNSNNLFCILKDNLPEKRAIDQYQESLTSKEVNKLMDSFYKWPHKSFSKKAQKIKFNHYVFGDPIILLDGSDASILDIPSAYLDNYCSHRKPIRFLKNTEVRCMVKLSELEMFDVYEYLNRSVFAGIPSKIKDNIDNLNSKNCSNVDCVNWTLNACDYESCQTFNHSLHLPSCDDFKCLNIATKLKFVFHCSGARIKRAEINLYYTNISSQSRHIQQEIAVKYLIEKGNASRAIELSGNAGYIVGKPVIKLHPSGNSFQFISNHTFPLRNIMGYPKNVAGKCKFSNTTHEVIKFGINSKNKCQFLYRWPAQEKNATKACNMLQTQLYEFLGVDLSEKNVISPLGNPSIVPKDGWLEVTTARPADPTGEYNDNSLVCYNFVSVFIYEFIHANFSRPQDATLPEFDRKIIKSAITFKDLERVQFYMEDAGFTVGTHVQFFDVTKPVIYEYARGPQLYIHFPSDFFYPFTSEAHKISISLFVEFALVFSFFL